ncbi:MAG TPA: alpha/beta hydrolase fold domain-containing protein [Roseiarcus sp.]|nr:alpha/beta hydrolase fold domain-containing protein [Roseiarcus sp.]
MTAPVLDRAARRFLDALNRVASPKAPTVESLRAAALALVPLASPAPPVERRDDALGALRLRLYCPPGRADDALPGLVYFHGGGLVAGDLDSHDSLAANLAAGAGCRIVAVDYARAPEAKFPAARNDAIAATLAAARDPGRFRLARVGVGGDSAGGQLAALAALAARDAGAPLALQLLLCPVMDALARTASRTALAEGHLLTEATMRAYWDAYRIEGLQPDDARAAPLAAADFSGLAPAIVHVADGDPLCDEGADYALRLSAAGVPCRLTRHAGLIHHFYGLGAVIPAARDALADVIAELKAALTA